MITLSEIQELGPEDAYEFFNILLLRDIKQKKGEKKIKVSIFRKIWDFITGYDLVVKE